MKLFTWLKNLDTPEVFAISFGMCMMGLALVFVIALTYADVKRATPEGIAAGEVLKRGRAETLSEAASHCNNRGGTKDATIGYKSYDLTVYCNDGTSVRFRIQ